VVLAELPPSVEPLDNRERLLGAQNQEMVAVLRDGEPVTEAAVRFGVSRQSGDTWMSRYQGGDRRVGGSIASAGELSAADTG
jgi:hypothetical protein